ncbi:hypothetical protein [Devosia sp.]|uniref:DUF1254 domain-containing protein n=1 Tax=Devosia sp. TaxID=1871048 RepID=UPI0032642461
MTRTLLWLLAGAVLGGIIHIAVILTLPALADRTIWTRVEGLQARNKIVLLPDVKPGEANPFSLDPALSYGLCQLDLAEGPAFVNGIMPDAFWSMAIFNRAGTIVYSTTNRDGIGRTLQLGIFNANQTRLLAQQQIDIAEGLLIVEAPSDQLFVVVRLAPPHQAVRARFETELSKITCGPKQ